MGRYQWVIFDIDDTLIDYKSASRNALERCFSDFDWRCPDDVFNRFSKIDAQLWALSQSGDITPEEVIVRKFEELAAEVSLPAQAEKMSELFTGNLIAQSPLILNALEVLTELHGLVNIAAGTNGISWIQRARIENAGITKFFSHIVVSEEAGYTKPSVDFFNHLHTRLDNPDKSGILMVGDSLHSDIAGGNAFGIDTCWFSPDPQPAVSGIEPSYRIANLDQLPEILR